MYDIFENSTLQREFNILAFASYPEAKILILTLITSTYLLCLLGNISITLLVCIERRLHTPMYFFLCNLSVQDIMYSSAVQPKLLDITITGNTSILFPHCIMQIFIFILCINAQFFLLTSMAFDRYVAICVALQYYVIMNKKLCLMLATICWVTGSLNSMMYSLILSKVPFGKSTDINHFFCEVEALLQLSCKETKGIQTLIFVEGLLIGVLPFVLILISYMFIIYNILKINTTAGRLRSFSSCSSHLTVVILLYGTCLSSYVKTEAKESNEPDKLISLFYIVFVPMLNPLVYSLRNKEVIKAIKKMMWQCIGTQPLTRFQTY